MVLRDYQKEAVKQIVSFYNSDYKIVALTMPLHSGIRLTSLAILERIASPTTRVVFVSERLRETYELQRICESAHFHVDGITASQALSNLKLLREDDPLVRADIIVFSEINFDRSRRPLLNLQANQKALYIGHTLPGIFAQTGACYSVPFEEVYPYLGRNVLKATPANDLYDLPADEQKDRLIQSQKEELQRITEALKKCQAEREADQRAIQILRKEKMAYQQVLANVGFRPESLKELNDRIVSFYQEDETQSSFPCEDRASYFEQQLSELIKQFVHDQKILKPNIVKTYQQRCLDFLGEDIFQKRFCESTRSDLVTALFTYESMVDSDAKDYLDYAGVCLLLSRSLEREVLTVVRNQYLAYLLARHPFDFLQTIDLPKALLDNRGKNGEKLQDWFERKCTLGSVSHLIGYSEEPKASILVSDFDRFKSFAKSNLYPSASEADIEVYLRSIVLDTSQVAKDYRNESAHVGYFDVDKAKECFDFILEVEKIMVRIFRPMAIPKEDFHDRTFASFFPQLSKTTK